MYSSRSEYKLMLLVIFMLVCACSDNHAKLDRAIRMLDADMPDASTYIVIPNQGCEGCISTAEAFVKKHVEYSDDIRYIFTRIQSVKLLRIKLGRDVMSSSKILLDTNNVIEYPDKKKQIYPMIVTMKDHKIDKVAYQSPDDDELNALTRE